MGVAKSLDIFQEKMSELMVGLDFVRTYLNDILCITKGGYNNHLKKPSDDFPAIKKSWVKSKFAKV